MICAACARGGRPGTTGSDALVVGRDTDPMPVTLTAGSIAHRLVTAGPWTVLLAAALYVPFAPDVGVFPASIDQSFRVSQLSNVLAYAVAILGLDLVTGYTGQLHLGQSAFIGLGAYTTVILVTDHGWTQLAAIPVACAVCLVAGLLVGLAGARIRGAYLAVVTLAFAYVFPPLVLRFGWLTGGTNGKGPPRGEGRLVPPSWAPFADEGRLAGPLWVYSLCLAIAVGVFVLTRNLMHSAVGRAMIATRDDPIGAAAFGIDPARTRAVAFGLSAVYGGLAGAMLMMDRPFASDVQFGTQLGLFLVVGLVVGGVGTMWGAIPGALVFVFLPLLVRQWTFDRGGMPPVLRELSWPLFRLLDSAGGAAVGVVFGSALLLLLFVVPDGIVGGARRHIAKLVRVERPG